MRVSTLLVVAALALLPVVLAANFDIIDASNIDSAFEGLQAHGHWQKFKAEHNKVYASKEHELNRFNIFQSNLARAAELQRLNPEASFGVTKFSDLHPTEFKRQYLNYRPAVGDAALLRKNVSVTAPRRHRHAAAIPTSYDWRRPDNGRPVGVTPVKDQGQCGSCWAFSATEAVESAWILSGKPAAVLAPEQTVDCDTTDGGCDGGDTVSAFAYMKTAGVMSEVSYPYTAGDSGSAGTCQYSASKVIAKIQGFTYATPGCDDACKKQDEDLLATNLYNKGPVSICVDASTWQSYQSGILTSASGCGSAYDSLDHCVQLVGYGVESVSGKKFWSVRNSWNTNWGEQGYIRLAYGANTCGVADEATQVTI